jgi:hypothetical protein
LNILRTPKERETDIKTSFFHFKIPGRASLLRRDTVPAKYRDVAIGFQFFLRKSG